MTALAILQSVSLGRLFRLILSIELVDLAILFVVVAVLLSHLLVGSLGRLEFFVGFRCQAGVFN